MYVKYKNQLTEIIRCAADMYFSKKYKNVKRQKGLEYYNCRMK